MKKAFKIILCVVLLAASAGLLYLAYNLFGGAHFIYTDGYNDNWQKYSGERLATWRDTVHYLVGLYLFSLPALAAFLPGALFGFIAFRLGLSLARGSTSHHTGQLHGT